MLQFDCQIYIALLVFQMIFQLSLELLKFVLKEVIYIYKSVCVRYLLFQMISIKTNWSTTQLGSGFLPTCSAWINPSWNILIKATYLLMALAKMNCCFL